MKKSLLALSLTVLFFSCKKEEAKTEFTATDVTGTTVVKGTITKNIITPAGSFSTWTTNGQIPAAGVVVQLKVNKSELYPNSIAQGADIYSATTDAQGNYAISVKTNATGVNAWMTINGFTGTLDTLVNGVVKTGLYANYFGQTSNLSLWMGINVQRPVYNFVASNLSTNPNNIVVGSAIVSGQVLANRALTVKTGTNAPVNQAGGTLTPVSSGLTVYMKLTNDPTTLAPKMYTATTDANGRYSFTFPTVASGTAGMPQDANVWVADFTATRDTIRDVNGVLAPSTTCPAGVYGNASNNQTGLFNNENRNAVNINHNGFTPN